VAGVLLAGGVVFGVCYDLANDGVLRFGAWSLLSGRAHGERVADVNGVRIVYETYGAGPPVVVLHPGGGDHATMRWQIVALAADHLVIAPDCRGHGRSSDVAVLHYDDMAADTVALMDRLHIARADVVGWSDGGIVGFTMAVRWPARVRRLVAIGANYDVAGAGAFASEPDPKDEAPAMVRLHRMWRTEPNFTAADLARITARTLVMAGEDDVIPREHTDAMARAIPGARELIVKGAGHGGPLEHPDAENPAIVDFLRARP
jgi:pimeloyl-ACP methyl ester carboxylesterase